MRAGLRGGGGRVGGEEGLLVAGGVCGAAGGVAVLVVSVPVSLRVGAAVHLAYARAGSIPSV